MFNIFRSKPQEPVELCFSTDIHCHVLPGIDDGAENIDTAVQIVEGMKGLGINRILASPHITYGTFENSDSTILPALDSLKTALKDKGISMDLSAHAEHRMDELFTSMLEKGTVRPLPNGYLLVENSYLQEPWNIEQLAFDIQVKGFTPILAHPERYVYYFRNKDRYRTLHNAGLKFQINLLSLALAYAKEEKVIAEWLMEQGLVDFIGTDIHHPAHVEIIEKYLRTKDARRHMSALAPVVQNDTAFITK